MGGMWKEGREEGRQGRSEEGRGGKGRKGEGGSKGRREE